MADRTHMIDRTEMAGAAAFKWRNHFTEATMALGEKLGRLLKGGEVISLSGDLGAGKTHFAKGVARGLEITGTVTSPTFTLINEYSGRLPLYHVDAYRLAGIEEAYDLGLEEYIYGEGVTLVEWPDRLAGLLPADLLVIEITRVDGENEHTREISFFPGPGYIELVRMLSGELKNRVRTGD